ncbi:hypothetical protein CULT_700031 [[Clostridium] ultunense Esp]|nr:hypothetical protein CULT_700031 [[Clostridium] ultunense Esp]
MIAATLHRLPGVGTGILTRIDELVRGDWQKVPGNRRWFRELPLKGEEIEAILEHLIPEKIEETEEELRRLGIKLHMRGESDYPRRLEEISNPPFLLYSLGDSSSLPKAVSSALWEPESPPPMVRSYLTSWRPIWQGRDGALLAGWPQGLTHLPIGGHYR